MELRVDVATGAATLQQLLELLDRLIEQLFLTIRIPLVERLHLQQLDEAKLALELFTRGALLDGAVEDQSRHVVEAEPKQAVGELQVIGNVGRGRCGRCQHARGHAGQDTGSEQMRQSNHDRLHAVQMGIGVTAFGWGYGAPVRSLPV